MKAGYYKVSPLAYGGTDRWEFTYSSAESLPVGQIVTVPFGRRSSLGVVTGPDEKPKFKTKSITDVYSLLPIPDSLVRLAEWLAQYYLASPKAVWTTMLPRGLSKTRRVKAADKAVKLPAMNLPLTPDQKAAIKLIQTSPDRNYLLHGVTGSGKTQVYIELARTALQKGQSAIILVPEIALTPQIIARFTAALGDSIISQHSKMTESQRHQIWTRALEAKQPLVAIGPRSTLFMPLKNLGLIVIDEAHETSYKQEQAPRYLADATAAKLAALTDAKLILGTATPSAGQVFLRRHGRLKLVDLPGRIGAQTLPASTIVDLRDKANLGTSRYLSKPLLDAIRATLDAKRQSLLFINRRGSASSQICGDCGHVSLCPNCQLPLTFHADQAKLICHTCNYQVTPPAVCPDCGGTNLRFLGVGTKRVEDEIKKFFPAARVARLDKDSLVNNSVAQIYQDLVDSKIDILIGTQMIAKGLDLPNVDTVGVVSADTALYLPDYTASERTFQLTAQVSGRAGRGDRPGQVIIQSYTPEHPAITAAASHDFWRFMDAELDQRQTLHYPPFVYLLKLTFAHTSAVKAQAAAQKLADTLKAPGLQIVGPAPAFREQAASKYHWQLVVKSPSRQKLIDTAKSAGTGWTIDLDPINLL